MKTEKPRDDLKDLIAAVTVRRNAISTQITCLENLLKYPPDDELKILLRWITEWSPSSTGVADWANEQGLRIATNKPIGRKYRAEDIAALINKPPDDWDSEPIEFFRSCYWTDRRKMDRGVTM